LHRLETDVRRCLDGLIRVNPAQFSQKVQSVASRDQANSVTETVTSSSPREVANQIAAWPRAQSNARRSNIVCWKCGQPGHIQRRCTQPQPDVPRAQPSEETQTPRAVTRGSKGLDRDNVYLSMKLAGRSVPCLLDSGCETTLIPKSVIDEARNVPVLSSNRRIWAANDTEIGVIGKVNAPFMLNGRCIMTFALISPDVEEVMLGADWLHEHRCLWDFGNRRL